MRKIVKSEIQDPSKNATHRLFVTFHLFSKRLMLCRSRKKISYKYHAKKSIASSAHCHFSLLRWDISGFVRLEVQRVEIGTAVHRDIGNLAAQLLHKRRVLIFGVYDIESGLSILES